MPLSLPSHPLDISFVSNTFCPQRLNTSKLNLLTGETYFILNKSFLPSLPGVNAEGSQRRQGPVSITLQQNVQVQRRRAGTLITPLAGIYGTFAIAKRRRINPILTNCLLAYTTKFKNWLDELNKYQE